MFLRNAWINKENDHSLLEGMIPLFLLLLTEFMWTKF